MLLSPWPHSGLPFHTPASLFHWPFGREVRLRTSVFCFLFFFLFIFVIRKTVFQCSGFWVCVFLFLFLCKYKFSVDAFFCLFFVVAPIPRQLCCVRVLVRVVSTNITNSPTIIWTTWLLRHHLVLHLCIIFVSCPLQQTPHSPYTKRFFCVFPVEQHGFFCPRWTTWYHVSDEFIWSISIIYLFLLSPFRCCCCWLLGCIGRRKKRRNMVHADVNAFLFLLFALSNDSCATKYRPRVFSSTHLRVYWWYGAQVGVTLQMVVCLFYMQPRAMCTTLKSGRGRQAAEQEEWMKNNTENATQKQQRWVPRKSILCANVWRTFNWKKHCECFAFEHIYKTNEEVFLCFCVCVLTSLPFIICGCRSTMTAMHFELSTAGIRVCARFLISCVPISCAFVGCRFFGTLKSLWLSCMSRSFYTFMSLLSIAHVFITRLQKQYCWAVRSLFYFFYRCHEKYASHHDH